MAKTLSEKLKYWRAERPDEWTMDEFIQDAKKLERQINEARDCLDCSPLDYPFRVIDNVTKILSKPSGSVDLH